MADGDIGAPVNTREFVPSDITRPTIIHIAGSVYAIAYTDASSHGQVITIDIAEDGVIGASVLGTLEFDGTAGTDPDIIHVAGTVYAITYKDSTNDGIVKTVTISNDGLTLALTGYSLIFDAAYAYQSNIIHVAGNTFAIVYAGGGNDGFIAAVSISADGETLSNIGASLEYDLNDGLEPSIVHVYGDIYAIAHTGAGGNGVITTVSVSAAGEMAVVSDPAVEFDGTDGFDSSIVHVIDNIYAVAYRGVDDDGFVVTVTISNAGAIALVGGAAGLLEFDTVYCTHPDLIHLHGEIFAIAYGGFADDGYVVTVQIDAVGQISALDSLEHDTNNGTQPSIIRVAGDQYAIAYVGTGLDGFVNTPTIVTPGEGKPRHLMMMGVG
jgi:hypothetical protein